MKLYCISKNCFIYETPLSTIELYYLPMKLLYLLTYEKFYLWNYLPIKLTLLWVDEPLLSIY